MPRQSICDKFGAPRISLAVAQRPTAGAERWRADHCCGAALSPRFGAGAFVLVASQGLGGSPQRIVGILYNPSKGEVLRGGPRRARPARRRPAAVAPVFARVKGPRAIRDEDDRPRHPHPPPPECNPGDGTLSRTSREREEPARWSRPERAGDLSPKAPGIH